MQISKPQRNLQMLIALGLAGAVLSGCATIGGAGKQPAPTAANQTSQKIEEDRRAILAMSGNYKVTFQFIETVSFIDGYELKDPKLTGGNEIVRVIRDEPGFISLQHILVVGGDEKFPVKHWRQDWIYEPGEVLEFIGFNQWQTRKLTQAERAGKWAQLVYQVDDGPRYGAVAAWRHQDGVSSWTSPPSLRPLPRRDATTREDYQAILAINRHALTPAGWVHEQDNTKLIMSRTGAMGRTALVRETGLNNYMSSDDFETQIGDAYWQTTQGFWAKVRAAWKTLATENETFGLTIQGEPEELYTQILEAADAVDTGAKPIDQAAQEAAALIDKYTTTKAPPAASMVQRN